MNQFAALFAAADSAIPSPSAVGEWMPLLMLLIPAGQAIWMEILRRRNKDTQAVVGEVKTAVAGVQVAVTENKVVTASLERQINSNLATQIEASINKAIANERLRVAGLPEARDSAVSAEATANVAKAQGEKAYEERLVALLTALEKKI